MRYVHVASALLICLASATASATDYTWNGSNGSWTDAARWSPAGGPPASSADTGAVSSGTAQATAALGTDSNRPTIQVNGTGKVQLNVNTDGHTFVLDGGKITMNNPGRFGTRTTTDTMRVQNSGTFEANGDTSIFYINGLIEDGASPGKVFTTSLVPTGGGACHVCFSGTVPNTYSGGTEILAGGLQAFSVGSLGTGDVLVRSGGFLRIGAAGVTAPSAKITVQGGGKVQFGSTVSGATFNCSGHTIELLDGAEVQLVQPGRYGSCTTADTFLTVGGTASFRIPNDSGKFNLDGPIQDGASAGKLWFRTQNVPSDGGYYVRAANSYSGGTDIESGARVYVQNAGGLSTGPIKVSTGGSLYLDQTPDANWSLTNNLAGAATVRVEDGSASYTLTATGSTISPGNSTGAAGTLAVSGNLAFARNGATPVTLNIDVVGSGSPVTITNDTLSVSRSVSGLSNVVLNVSISGASYQNLAGLKLPVLLASNDLTGQAFASVNYPEGWNGVLSYEAGRVTLELQASPSAPPSTITDLVAGSATASTATLSWTAPGAHGTTGAAASYDIRYSTSAISEANWGAATPVNGEPAPLPYGSAQIMVVAGLAPDTVCYFAIKSVNEAPAVSGLSNVVSILTRVSDDITPPAAVSDLAADYPGSNHITLSWTVPGDDGTAGTASAYDIRYAAGPITTANWSAATPVIGEPAPLAPGSHQSMKVTGLTPATTYYFALKVADEVPNLSALSNVVTIQTGPPSDDVIPPSAVTSLAGTWPSGTTVDLTWTAPGDDSVVGTATHYDIRYATSPITDANWEEAAQAPNEPDPAAAGTGERITVMGLNKNTTYYFALKSADENYNWSPLSNVAAFATTGPDVTGPSAVTNLVISDVTATSARLTWTVSGNDGMLNQAAANDIRYSTSPITSESWFVTAVKVTGEPAPTAAGTSQTMVVTGLNEGTTYSFAIRILDDSMNWSGLSNVVSAATLTAPDTTAPAAISNLVASHPSSTTVRLTWTAPGDDGNSGTAASYEIRYSKSPIDEGNWDNATPFASTPIPQVAGTKQTWTVYGLSLAATYHFAIRTRDEAGNLSGLSNVVSATTLSSGNMNKPALTPQDFEYIGAFKLPPNAFGESNAYGDSGLALRRVNGSIQLLAGGHRYTGDAIYECTFPGWSSGAPATWPQSTLIREWGQAVYGSPSKKIVKGGPETGWTHGIQYDQARGRLYYSFGSWYNIPNTNDPCLAYATLDEAGAVPHGSWNADPAIAHTQRIRGGSLAIPSWFADAYLGGRSLGLGFGGYYSGFASCSRGVYLAAANHPEDSQTQLDVRRLLDGTDAHYGTRDADYWTNTAPNPVGDVGYWTFADSVHGGAVWIDLPDKHGLLYMSMMGHGNISYIHSDIYPKRREAHWWVYDPKDLAAVAEGSQQPWDPKPQTWMVQYDPRPSGGFNQPGCAFDPQTRTLFVLVTGAYTSGGLGLPAVHGYRIRESFITGDITRDGVVDVDDLLTFAASWAKSSGEPGFDPTCDLDGSGEVDVTDLLMLAENWAK